MMLMAQDWWKLMTAEIDDMLNGVICDYSLRLPLLPRQLSWFRGKKV